MTISVNVQNITEAHVLDCRTAGFGVVVIGDGENEAHLFITGLPNDYREHTERILAAVQGYIDARNAATAENQGDLMR